MADDALKVEGTVHQYEPTRTVAAPLWLLLARFIKALPSYKDTKRGRQNVMQLRFVLLASGIACIAFGGSNMWVAIGVVVCVLPLIAPVESGRQTAWVSSLRDNATTVKKSRDTGTVERVKNRVTVEVGSKTWSASVKKKKRKVVSDDRALIGFRDENGDRLWFRTNDIPHNFPETAPDPKEQFRVVVDVDLETFERLDG